ncbi:hypothetical protein BDV93DRAFT_565925 [Ceratobasidium sp. AG-I]|nr:hypothetical protein BDV93DRAFT_565925 [Ceratobasidium sp. AG-I]
MCKSTTSSFLAIPELVLHTLYQLPSSKFSDTSVKTLLSCSLASRALRDVVKTESLWRWHYVVRYGDVRGSGDGGAPQWYTLYTHRRTLDTIALYHLTRIISTPSDRSEAITELIDLGDEVKNVLKMEATCRVPEEVEDVWDPEEDEWKGEERDEWEETEEDTREVRGDWIERRWWAKQALGTICRVGGVKTMASLFVGDAGARPRPTDPGNAVMFEEGLIALSSFMGVDVSRIPGYFDSLSEKCKHHLESKEICADPGRGEFDLEAFSKGVCEWMASRSFKRSANDGQYYNLMNHFPHKFLTTHRRSLPMSLVCVFVSLVRRMGLRAAPVGFPGNVHAWIALPSTSTTNDVGGGDWANTAPARELRVDVFHADEEPLLEAGNLREVLGHMGVPRSEYGEAMRPSSAGDMVLRAANNILHSVTRVQQFIDGSITPETRGAALYTAAMAILLARPTAPDVTRYTTAITTVIKSQFPLDTTPILSYLTTHAFPTGPVHTRLADAASEIKDDEGPGPVKEREKEGVKWWVGMMFRHKRYNYVGLVLGWDGECKAGDDWIRALRVDDLPRGRGQPFYRVVTDSGESMYVAEENMLPLPIDETSTSESDRLDWVTIRRLISNASQSIAQTFARVEVDEPNGRAWFIPGVAVQLEHPDDPALGRAYMRGDSVPKAMAEV